MDPLAKAEKAKVVADLVLAARAEKTPVDADLALVEKAEKPQEVMVAEMLMEKAEKLPLPGR